MSLSLVTFTAYGIPQPKGSTRAFVKNGRAIVTSDNPKLKDWQHAIAASAAVVSRGHLFGGPVYITAEFRLLHPKTGKRRAAHVTKPDLDKLSRALCDALTGVLWADDSQVVELRVTKSYCSLEEAPHVAVQVAGELEMAA